MTLFFYYVRQHDGHQSILGSPVDLGPSGRITDETVLAYLNGH
jgi:hypothetical protein